MTRSVALFLAAGLLAPQSAAAATLYVQPTGQTPFVDIQDAIDAALDGDVIQVFPGSYGPIDFDGKDLVVRSTGGPDLTTIDGGGLGAAVRFDDEEPTTALLHGFTITGGVGEVDDSLLLLVGGGVHVSKQSSPRISGNVIRGNSAEAGAGIAITGGSPSLYGNVVRDNTATNGAGGLYVFDPLGAVTNTVIACNSFLGNLGGTVGGLALDGVVTVTNNVVHGNVGERGGIWLTPTSSGVLYNNTFTTNVSDPGNAAGVHMETSAVVAVGNLVAFNALGYGVIHSSPSPAWTYSSLAQNAGGDWSGAASSPVGIGGNVSATPQFAAFTPSDPYDDDLSLLPSDPLRDASSPLAAFADLDGSRGAMGADGGPRTACDLDGDGVRASDAPADCQPSDAVFFPGAYELEGGEDQDCDGFGTMSLAELVLDDGGLLPDGGGIWDFAVPALLPGRGWQGTSAWCTGCLAVTPSAAVGALEWAADLTSLPVGTGIRLHIVHAYDADSTLHAGTVEASTGGAWAQLGLDGGYPAALPGTATTNALLGAVPLGTFAGDSMGYVTDAIPLDALATFDADLRFRFGTSAGSTPLGWTIARLAVQVMDRDGDGRAAVLADCDDDEVTVYVGAPEIPYDSQDQDCDGFDLEDVDGDGFLAVVVGGDDCDDDDAGTNPGGVEVAYDGLDQDCDGADLDDLDGDGFLAWEVGGLDCDDGDAEISPAADEIPYDDEDQDCDGADLVDVDGDGFRGDQPPPFGDCDDLDATVHPGAEEQCDDGQDNNCDELVDREIDFDEDGFDRCAGDCDEQSPLVHPDAIEVCDGVDTDCDGAVPTDEVDADLDGVFVCGGDCDDGDPAVASGFPELCDGRDNDCDAGIDEDQDDDLDGFSGCGADCDDQRSSVYPGAPRDCADNLDHDCDGEPDFSEAECLASAGCSGCEASVGAHETSAGLLLVLPSIMLRRWARRRASPR